MSFFLVGDCHCSPKAGVFQFSVFVLIFIFNLMLILLYFIIFTLLFKAIYERI